MMASNILQYHSHYPLDIVIVHIDIRLDQLQDRLFLQSPLQILRFVFLLDYLLFYLVREDLIVTSFCHDVSVMPNYSKKTTSSGMNGKSFIQALNFSSNSDYKMYDYRYGSVEKTGNNRVESN
jgi:hypothetical protein